MNKPSHDEVVIVCMRVHPEPELITAGSVLGKCSECSADVWIAPSSVSISTKRYETARFICLHCFNRHVHEFRPSNFRAFPEQRIEVEENLKRRKQ